MSVPQGRGISQTPLLCDSRAQQSPKAESTTKQVHYSIVYNNHILETIYVFIKMDIGKQIMGPLMESYAAVKKTEVELYTSKWQRSIIYSVKGKQHVSEQSTQYYLICIKQSKPKPYVYIHVFKIHFKNFRCYQLLIEWPVYTDTYFLKFNKGIYCSCIEKPI